MTGKCLNNKVEGPACKGKTTCLELKVKTENKSENHKEGRKEGRKEGMQSWHIAAFCGRTE